MSLKISFLCERFATDFALVRPIIEMNSHMALCIAKPGEGFFVDKACEALAEPASLLIHNEAALQCSFDSLSIIILDLCLSVVFT